MAAAPCLPRRRFRASYAAYLEHGRIVLAADPDSVQFQLKILERSGLGEETTIPPAMHYIPPAPDFSRAKEEAELFVFSAMDALFEKTKLNPRDVDILILNCSLYSPTPSMMAMVINRYRMRCDVKSFNHTGMGCSAGLIAVDLAPFGNVTGRSSRRSTGRGRIASINTREVVQV